MFHICQLVNLLPQWYVFRLEMCERVSPNNPCSNLQTYNLSMYIRASSLIYQLSPSLCVSKESLRATLNKLLRCLGPLTSLDFSTFHHCDAFHNSIARSFQFHTFERNFRCLIQRNKFNNQKCLFYKDNVAKTGRVPP